MAAGVLVLRRSEMGRGRARLGGRGLIVKYLLSEGTPVTVAVDGTFFRRWGRHVCQARWAYDGSAQGGKKTAYGNTWVVAAIVVRLRFCPSPVALPVLFRLWRGKGTASQVELAAQLVKVLAGAFPAARFTGRGTPRSTGNPWPSRGQRGRRGCGNAVLHGPKPPPTGKRGRPRRRETASAPAPTPRSTRTGAIP